MPGDEGPDGDAAGGGTAPPPAATFLLVRHGATAHTAQRRFSGCTGANPPLSALGERQAALLAARLGAVSGVGSGGPDGAGVGSGVAGVGSGELGRIAAVVSSPVARARRTAEVVAAACGASLHVDVDLREVDFGAWEGHTLGEVEQGWPDALAAWRAASSVAPPGGESVDEVAARVAGVRRLLAGRYPGSVVVLVSHLYPVRLSVLDAIAAPYTSVHRMALEPTSISEIRATAPGAATLVRYNDVAHLIPKPPTGAGDG